MHALFMHVAGFKDLAPKKAPQNLPQIASSFAEQICCGAVINTKLVQGATPRSLKTPALRAFCSAALQQASLMHMGRFAIAWLW